MKIYTDGSCSRRSGGWSAIIALDEDEEVSLSGRVEDTTNNRMELMAVIKALFYLSRRDLYDTDLEIFTDSQYVIGCATGWKRNANNDMWETYDELKGRFKSVSFEWVKGHNGHEYNERADKLARGI